MTYEEFMPHWKKQDQCFEDEQVEMIDSLHGHKIMKNGKTVIKAWPHDKAQNRLITRIGWNKLSIQVLKNSIQQGTNKEIPLKEPEPDIQSHK
jgi:hypothetical protein